MRDDARHALDGLSPTSPYRATMLHAEAIVLPPRRRPRPGRRSASSERLRPAIGVRRRPAGGAGPRRAVDPGAFAWRRAVGRRPAQAGGRDGRDRPSRGVLDQCPGVRRGRSRSVAAAASMREARRSSAGRPGCARCSPTRCPSSRSRRCSSSRTPTSRIVDPAGARAALDQAPAILLRRPDLGTLVDAVAELRGTGRPDHPVADRVGASSLTTAELRLLPLLPTHLSFREIADRLYVSRTRSSPRSSRSTASSASRRAGRPSTAIAELGHRRCERVSRAAPAGGRRRAARWPSRSAPGSPHRCSGRSSCRRRTGCPPRAPCSRCPGPRSAGSVPNRTVPAWCAQPATGMSFFM